MLHIIIIILKPRRVCVVCAADVSPQVRSDFSGERRHIYEVVSNKNGEKDHEVSRAGPAVKNPNLTVILELDVLIRINDIRHFNNTHYTNDSWQTLYQLF